MLDLAYEAVKRFKRQDVVRMSRRLKQELLTLCIFAPLMYTDLRAQFSSEIHLTDASSALKAVVSAPLDVNVVREVSRFALKKGRWVRMLTPVQRWLKEHGMLGEAEELPEGSLAEEPGVPIFEELVTSLEFETTLVCKTCRGSHINVSELEAIGLAEGQIRHSAHRTRPLVGSDSQVALAAAIKGRASSVKLNQVLRRMLVNVAVGRLRPSFFWVPTSLNVADDPTRNRSNRKASSALPSWARSLLGSPCCTRELDARVDELYGDAGDTHILLTYIHHVVRSRRPFWWGMCSRS